MLRSVERRRFFRPPNSVLSLPRAEPRGSISEPRLYAETATVSRGAAGAEKNRSTASNIACSLFAS